MNFIDIVTRTENHSDVAKTDLRLLCNALTGALVREAETFVRNRRKGITQPDEIADEYSAAEEHQPNLNDQDSEKDRLDSEGKTLDQLVAEAQGREFRDPAKDMAILNGLRHFVYNDLFKFVDVPKANSALYLEKPREEGKAPNWDQPMSAQRFLEFRIQLAGRVNERDLKDAVAEDPSADERNLRQIFAESAVRRQAALQELKLDILSEIMSLPMDTHDIDGFKTSDSASWEQLPAKTRVTIATRVRDGLQREHDRLQTIRTPEMAGRRALLRDEIKIVTKALDTLVQHVRAQID